MPYPHQFPPQTIKTVTSYPIAPAGYPADLRRRVKRWNDAILAYRLRYEPVYADPEASPRSYTDVAKLVAEFNHKPVLSKQRIEQMCRWVADQIMIEQLASGSD